VANCREGNGGLHGSIERFHEHHRVRRGRLVRERLQRETPVVQRAALKLLAPDLLDNGRQIVVEM